MLSSDSCQAEKLFFHLGCFMGKKCKTPDSSPCSCWVVVLFSRTMFHWVKVLVLLFCCREVSAFPCLRLGFYWRSDFDVYASSFLPAYQPASNNSLKSHVACFVYIVLFSTFWNWTIWNVWLLVLICNRYTVPVWYHRNHVCRLILSCI